MTCQPTMFIFCRLHLRSLVGILNNELNIGRRWNTRRPQVQRANMKEYDWLYRRRRRLCKNIHVSIWPTQIAALEFEGQQFPLTTFACSSTAFLSPSQNKSLF